MMKFPMRDGAMFIVIEPGNIERLKSGRPLKVGEHLVAFTPDMQKFAELLGVSGELPERGRERINFVCLTPEEIEAALSACKKLPEVIR